MPKRSSSSENSPLSSSSSKIKFSSSKNLIEKPLYSISETDENESSQTIAKLIIEDLMFNVMNEIYELYMKKQTVNFTVHCAHKAFEKVLSLHLYQHNDYKSFHDENDKSWVPDHPPQPSPQDSWAAHRLSPNQFQNLPHQQDLNTISQIKLNQDDDDGLEGAADSSGHYEDDEVSYISELSITKVMDGIIDNMSFSSRGDSGTFLKEASVFSVVAKESVDYLDYDLQPGYSKLGVVDKVKLPQIPLPGSQINVKKDADRMQNRQLLDKFESLPPIRTSAKNKYRIDHPEPCDHPQKSSKRK